MMAQELTVVPGPMGWGWVQIRHLCQAAGVREEELLTRYIHASKDVFELPVWDGEGAVLVVSRGGPGRPDGDKDFYAAPVLPGGERGEETAVVGEFIPPTWFVPAGWALDVLRLVREGVTEVQLIQVPATCDAAEMRDWEEAYSSGRTEHRDPVAAALADAITDRLECGYWWAGVPVR